MGRRCFRTRGSHNGGNRGGSNGRTNGYRTRGDPGSSARTRSGACTSRTGAGFCTGGTGRTGGAFSCRQCLQGNHKRYEE